MKPWKKFRAALVLFTALVLTAPIAQPLAPAVTAQAAAAKINYSKKTLKVGQTLKLKVSKTKKITWSSNKKAVAAVGKTTGKVTALKSGKAKITGKAGKKKYTCTITVKNDAVTKAGFEAKDFVFGDFNVVLPKDWVTTVNSNSSTYQMNAAPASGESLYAVVTTKTGTPALDYDAFKATQEPYLTAEYQEQGFAASGYTDPKITDFKTEDVSSTLGKYIKVTFTLDATVKGTAVKQKWVIFAICIDNYIISFNAVGAADSSSDTVFEMADYIFNNMKVVK